MADFNDGNWHIHTGDACPVHKSSLVEAVWRAPHYESGATIGTKLAREIMWQFDCPSSVIAFRVVKEHRDPRDFWLDELTGKVSTSPCPCCTHVREVL